MRSCGTMPKTAFFCPRAPHPDGWFPVAPFLLADPQKSAAGLLPTCILKCLSRREWMWLRAHSYQQPPLLSWTRPWECLPCGELQNSTLSLSASFFVKGPFNCWKKAGSGGVQGWWKKDYTYTSVFCSQSGWKYLNWYFVVTICNHEVGKWWRASWDILRNRPGTSCFLAFVPSVGRDIHLIFQVYDFRKTMPTHVHGN